MCGDAEPFVISRSEYPKARKIHKCCECGSDIDPGEKYQKITGLFEGSWEEFKTCQICQDIRAEAEAELGYPIGLTCLYEETGTEFEYAGA